MRSGLAGVMAKTVLAGSQWDCRWRRRRRVMPRCTQACRLDLRSNPLIAIDPLSARRAAPTRGRRSGLHGDGVVVHLPDNPHGRRAAPFHVRSLAHACASSASEGCSAQDLSRSWSARARQHDRHEHGGDGRRADNRHRLRHRIAVDTRGGSRMRESRTYGSGQGARGNSRSYREDLFAAVHESASVKVFGCRPRRTMPQTLAAGVRKPPRDETAIWARWPGRVGRHPQLWGFELWTDRSNGQGARGLS